MQRVHIHITGIVQGVGMRPFVYREAVAAGVSGWVLNAGDGVHIEAAAEKPALDAFVRALREHAPAAARIDAIDVEVLEEAKGFARDAHAGARDAAPNGTHDAVPASTHGAAATQGAAPAGAHGFQIVPSDDTSERTTLVSPDIATCPDCLRELFDPADRRYHYPFINCTNCGPRFTIIESLPYDRPATSMAEFPMCEACAHEYADPLDRRFHAQPDACFACGPHITWRERSEAAARVGSTREVSDALIERCAEMLASGGIVAIKGLGGFHLACDASNEAAVAELRARKCRPRKPFAVMMASLSCVEAACTVSAKERELLQGSIRPIVLLRQRANAGGDRPSRPDAMPHLAPSVAFDLPELGVMLPYTPLQHLLFAACAKWGMHALVMTSGNVSGEPIETDDAQAWQNLVERGIADALLGNNRAILSRYDDSVVRVGNDGRVYSVRRARGYAPQPLDLPPASSREGDTASPEKCAPFCILACGAEQKATLAFTRESGQGTALCFLSQHIGDVEQPRTLDAWHEARTRMGDLFDLHVQALACDLHPSYLTAQWARSEAARQGIPLIEVQHHHAHIAAAMAEAATYEGFDPHEPVVGIAFDGTGAGTDGTVWGGEFLIATLARFERAAHLATWPLPGGVAAIRDSKRNAYALLHQYGLLGHPGARGLLDRLGTETCNILSTMLERDLNCPATSSMGRFLDACAALLGICDVATYEGEPAIELEAAASRSHPKRYGSKTIYSSFDQNVVLQFRYARCGDASDAECPPRPASSGEKPQDRTDRKMQEQACSTANGAKRGSESRKSELEHHFSDESRENRAPVHRRDAENAFIIDPAPLLAILLDGIARGDDVNALALAVHDAVARMAAETAASIAQERGLRTAALGGGVFMNRLILERTQDLLEAKGLRVLVPHRVPLNDGGIAYGQAAIARARGGAG